MSYEWTATLWYDDIEPQDHVTTGDSQLLWQYSDKPRLRALLSASLSQSQSLEDLAFAVLVGRSVYTAVGVQLDVLGKIVGQDRGEMGDDPYRLFVVARILVNRSNARIPELVDLLELLDVPTIKIMEYYPGELHISVAGTEYGELIGELISQASTGGMALRWTWSNEDADNTFTLSNTLGVDETDPNRGLGDLGGASTTGGRLSGGYVR